MRYRLDEYEGDMNSYKCSNVGRTPWLRLSKYGNGYKAPFPELRTLSDIRGEICSGKLYDSWLGLIPSTARQFGP